MTKLLALAVSAFAFSAAASNVVPEDPRPFELVNLRLTVDSCAFNPETVMVVTTKDAIRVQMRDNQCFVAGVPRDVDIRLGAYPVGTYNVEVASLNGEAASVRERLFFSVVPRASIAVFPPQPFPLTDYSGLWWDPALPGWGVSIHQSPSDSLFTAVFDYADGVSGAPNWITLQSGQWVTATTWVGSAFRTTFPPLTVQDLGSAELAFDVPPPVGASAGSRYARLRYVTPEGVLVTSFITRQAF